MFHRCITHSFNSSFFIFGARGVGKTSYIRDQFRRSYHYLNLLEEHLETRYARNPGLLKDDLRALSPRPEWIVIDEVQKAPRLLDVVHDLIETEKYKFILTGSSARKLKRGSANLLAGRAFTYNMYPLTHVELGAAFNLDEVMRWGSLPRIYSLAPEDKAEYLRSYCQTYLKEEILQEQLVRNNLAFRGFLQIAAQQNGKALTFAKIARDIGVDTKTAQSFFQILEDTLVGFFLPAFHLSARKSVKLQPKFYLFDLGVKRALESTLNDSFHPRTSAYGQMFEHFVICEAIRLNNYRRADFQFYHYQTSAGGEIDLVLKRGKRTIAIEIKSTDQIDPVEARKVARVAEGIEATEIYYVSQDPTESKIDSVHCMPWKIFLGLLFQA